MIYTVGRLLEDLRVFAGNATGDFFGQKAPMLAEEALTIFLSPRWPFNEGEAAVACVAPYSTGTVAVTLNSKNVVLTGGTWLTSWVTPAIIRINGSSGDSIVVASFDSPTGLTLDIEWPFASDAAATYSIEFPSHTIPSYISVTGVVECRLSMRRFLAQARFEDLLGKRPWMPQTYWPGEYAIIPADGTNSQKLFIWPPPAQVQTLRYRYVKAVPAFRYYRTGTADVVNGNTAVAGTSTYWLKQGYSMVGQYLEALDQPGIQVAVSAVGSDTGLTLVAGGWTGVGAAGTPYCISPGILCPDDLKPLLRAICRWKYLQDAAPALAPEAERRYKTLRDQAVSRCDIGRDASGFMPIETQNFDWGGPPPTPSILKLT